MRICNIKLISSLHDRTGRLEILITQSARFLQLHDRTGRLESLNTRLLVQLCLHDRTGRLETQRRA